MASSYPVSVGAFQVGSYFVKQYYQVLQQQPDFVHQFYTDESTVVRIDGDSSESASALLQIHALTISLNFTGIEIKTINALESWSRGVLVVVSGSVKSRDFSGWRKFVQTFFLAPQDTGYFVLNDIFHFVTDEVAHHHPVPILSENRAYSQPATSSPLPESPVSDYALEVETSEKLNSVHIEDDDPVDEYSIHEQQLLQQQQEEEYPAAESEEETPAEESYGLPQNAVVAEQEPQPHVEEFTGEPQKFTYASILQASKGKPVPSVATTHSYRNKSTTPATEWQQPPQPTVQTSNPVASYVPTSNVEVAEEGFSQDEGELKSVYVRNLPLTVSNVDILQEFQKFGTIKPDGVFIRNRKEIGVCFAFVEFEDIEGVQNAIKASPIQLDDRQVYIEERRANSSGTSRGGIGGRRGRGRGSYQEAPRGRFGGRTSGRGIYQDSGDYRSRGNGVRGSY
ncbi:hypothetical protein LguiA_020559 [Lonicera macranthoides]